jgi:NitT/TauT family transport system substrate-binding protein
MNRFLKQLITLIIIVVAFVRIAGAAETPTLKIGYLPITHSLAVVVADKLNTGKYKNLKTELVKFSSWPELLDAYNSGKVQAVSELLVLALAGAEKGVPESVVALSHRHGDILTVAKDINSVRDLKGKRVAIPHRMSVHNILLSQALKKEGLTLKDVEWIELPPPDMPAALARGDVKAFIVAEPFGTKAIQAGFGKKLLNAKDIWADYICCGLVINPAFKKQYPAAVKEYVDSFTAAGRFIDTNRKEAIKIARGYMNIDEKLLEQSLSHDVTYGDLRINRGEVEQLQKYALELNLLKKPVNLDGLLDQTLVAAPVKKGKK